MCKICENYEEHNNRHITYKDDYYRAIATANVDGYCIPPFSKISIHKLPSLLSLDSLNYVIDHKDSGGWNPNWIKVIENEMIERCLLGHA